MVRPHKPADAMAVNTLGLEKLALSRSRTPITAPAASAASNAVYLVPVWSAPRKLAYAGICAWNALPTRNDVAPAMTTIDMMRDSLRTAPKTFHASARADVGVV
jgi:hypothetical protein